MAEEAAGAAGGAQLPAEVVVEHLQRQNALRAAALNQCEGKRTYQVLYRGFPNDHDAEMVPVFTRAG